MPITKALQSTLTTEQVLHLLQEGNQRFCAGTSMKRNAKIDIACTVTAQYPMAVVLGCIDSRVPVEDIFDRGIGDLFCIRIAGNIVNDDVIASIEYSCNIAGARLIVVLGHTNCGAVGAAFKVM